MIELKVDFFVSSVLVESEIWNKNLERFSKLNMIFDTGASITTIDTKIIRRAGYSMKSAEETIVAGIGDGRTPAKKIVLDSLKLGGFDLGPVLVYVVDFPDEVSTPALLGMNVIKEFKVIADFKDKKPDGRDATIYLEPSFNIDDKLNFSDFIISKSRFGSWMVDELNTQK